MHDVRISLLLEGEKKGEEKQLFASLLFLCAFSFRLRAAWPSYRENNFIEKGSEYIVTTLIERLRPKWVSLL